MHAALARLPYGKGESAWTEFDRMVALLHQQREWRPTAAAILVNEHDLVATVRPNNPERNWSIPQGGIEPGERFLDALARELGEELGLEPGQFVIRRPLHSGFVAYDESDPRTAGEFRSGKWYGVAGVRLLPGVVPSLTPKDGSEPELLDLRWLEPSLAAYHCIIQPDVEWPTVQTRLKGVRILAPAIEAMTAPCQY